MIFPAEEADMDMIDRVSLLAAAPFRYGLVLAAAAAWLQVAAYVVYVVGHSGADGLAEPPFDGTGTLCWEANAGLSKQVADFVAWITHAFLEGGLLLGCIGR